MHSEYYWMSFLLWYKFQNRKSPKQHSRVVDNLLWRLTAVFTHLVVDIEPLRMVIHRLCCQRNPGHKAKGLDGTESRKDVLKHNFWTWITSCPYGVTLPCLTLKCGPKSWLTLWHQIGLGQDMDIDRLLITAPNLIKYSQHYIIQQ